MANPPGWVVIPNSGDMYLVNEEGQVFSRHCGRILKPGIASNGYPTVVIGSQGTRTLHSLVADAFLGPWPPGQEVRHKDDIRTHPQLSNLEYGTRHQNIMDAVERGRWSSPGRKAGWEARKALTQEQAIFVRNNYPALSMRALGRELGVTHGTVKRYLTEKGVHNEFAELGCD